MAKAIKLRGKIMYKNVIKKQDKVKKKWDGRKFWTKNQDGPSKSGTVGGYVAVAQKFYFIVQSYMQAGS